jgi:hypothetical protein
MRFANHVRAAAFCQTKQQSVDNRFLANLLSPN